MSDSYSNDAANYPWSGWGSALKKTGQSTLDMVNSVFPNSTDPLAAGALLATNPEAAAEQLAKQGIPPPSLPGPGPFTGPTPQGNMFAGPTSGGSAFQGPVSGGPAVPPTPGPPASGASPPPVSSSTSRAPASPTAPVAQTPQQKDALMRALTGVTAPKPPEIQKLTTHAPPAVHAMPANALGPLLAAILGQTQQGSGLRLGQALGGH